MANKHVAIIGAGPAALTAAYLLSKAGIRATVLESDPKYVGGISRTINYKGFRLDVGGHRFFSKSRKIYDLWNEILPNDFLLRPRSSKIYYQKKFFSYPLKPMETFWNLNFWDFASCISSYIGSKTHPIDSPDSFEKWICNQFGRHLFDIFFKSYTEKVLGMDCREISSDWACQRIKGLSLGKSIQHALVPKRIVKNSDCVKSLIGQFHYPRLGPGMMWDAAARKFERNGGVIRMGLHVNGLDYNPREGNWRVRFRDASCQTGSLIADEVISTAPMKEMVSMICPPLNEALRRSAMRLRYRDFMMVGLIVEAKELFPDNWLYIHDPDVLVGRIQNFKSWSPEMVPDTRFCCYGLEYFCFETDELWRKSDEEIIELAKKEFEQIGLGKGVRIIDATVVRQPKAYPVYTLDYRQDVSIIRDEIEARYPSLHLIGRNGMHKYNNQDHAMMTAMLTVENILMGHRDLNVWNVNQDAEYIESGTA